MDFCMSTSPNMQAGRVRTDGVLVGQHKAGHPSGQQVPGQGQHQQALHRPGGHPRTDKKEN